MPEDNYKPLFEYLDEKFGEMGERMGTLERGFQSLQSSVDTYAKKADTYYQEMAVMRHRLERMEEWIKQASGKIGIEYKT